MASMIRRFYILPVNPEVPDARVREMTDVLSAADRFIPVLLDSSAGVDLDSPTVIWENTFVDEASYSVPYMVHPYHIGAIDNYVMPDSPECITDNTYATRYTTPDAAQEVRGGIRRVLLLNASTDADGEALKALAAQPQGVAASAFGADDVGWVSAKGRPWTHIDRVTAALVAVSDQHPLIARPALELDRDREAPHLDQLQAPPTLQRGGTGNDSNWLVVCHGRGRPHEELVEPALVEWIDLVRPLSAVPGVHQFGDATRLFGGPILHLSGVGIEVVELPPVGIKIGKRLVAGDDLPAVAVIAPVPGDLVDLLAVARRRVSIGERGDERRPRKRLGRIRRCFDADHVEQGREDVGDMLVLVADLPRRRHRWAPHNERHLMAASMGAAPVETERRVADVGPAALVVRERLRAAKEVEPLEVFAPDVGVVDERGEELRGSAGLALAGGAVSDKNTMVSSHTPSSSKLARRRPNDTSNVSTKAA